MSNRMEKLYLDAIDMGIMAVDEMNKKIKLPVLFVAPLGVAVPDDQVLTYLTIDKFADILNVEAGSVVLFRKDQAKMLSVLAQDADLFGFDVNALMGLPGTEYDRWFEEATFSREKVSYAPLISEIRISDEVEAAKSANIKTDHDKERDRTRKSDGTVRYHDDIGVVSEDDQREDDEDGAGNV